MRVEKSLVGSTPGKFPEREAANGFKRVGHGGVAWTASADADNLHQPQDGAQENGTLYTAITRLAHREPEDARLTGGTRSLMRRVMGLNVTTPAPARKATSSAAKSQAIPALAQAQVA